MEVLPTNGRIDYLPSVGRSNFFLTILTQIDTLILVLDTHDYSAKVRNYFSLLEYLNFLKLAVFSQNLQLKLTNFGPSN